MVLTGVHSDCPLISNAAAGTSVSNSPDTDNDPLLGTSGSQAPTSDAFTDTPAPTSTFCMFIFENYYKYNTLIKGVDF